MSDPSQPTPDFPLPALDQFDFHARLTDMTGTSLVMFTAPDCGSCRHLRQVLHEVRRRRPGWHIFTVDAERDQALVNEFEVFHLPTVFLFNGGQFHCELATAARPDAVIAAVGAALQQPAAEAP